MPEPHRQVVDILAAVVGREPTYVSLVGPPGSASVTTTADPEPSYRGIAGARVTVRRYDIEHFAIYFDNGFEQAVTEQTAHSASPHPTPRPRIGRSAQPSPDTTPAIANERTCPM